jgi:hypothetical protein
MSELSPCPSCHRHVRVEETVCPFCEAALPERARVGVRTTPAPRGRLSRTALFAAGATLMGAAACSSTSNNPNTDGGGTGGMHQDGAAGAGGHDAGEDSGNAGAGGNGGEAGSDAGSGHDGPIAIYSAAFPPLTPKT